MKVDHTPGPWTITPGDNDFREGHGINSPSGPVVRPCCGAGIFSVADAALIAAAPDLLLNLKCVVMLAERLGPMAHKVHKEEAEALLKGTLRDAREAIAKAQSTVC